ncbi:carbohydrate ABC transporter permease [Paenibacillus sp. 1P07SE]|uniref:carbohydrate ABC transporter permease n=1 Tax=Paenibacillus sp. 1P07SE TaxID=3132209 RepID=UPI0039A565D5
MRQSVQDHIVEIVNLILLSLIALAVIYPLVFVFSASISNQTYVFNGQMWLWPRDISLVGYEKIFQNREVLTGYLNTLLYTSVGTLVNVILTVMAAYPLSRRDFRGRHLFTGMMVFTLFFSGGLIPTYMVVRSLGIMNTMWALILPGAVSVWNIIIMRTFFQSSIPDGIQEAAQIDGCRNLQILTRIVLPLSAPILAVMVLFYSVGHWNAFFNALIYLTDRELYPLQLFLREILIQDQMEEMVNVGDNTNAQNILDREAVKYAMVIVANLPILMLYPFLQKYFAKGVMIGAIKG